MFLAKALELSKEMNVQNNFVASNGWLHRWKCRHGIREIRVCGEKMCADRKAVEEFKMEFAQTIINENLTLPQIFNADETGLNIKLLPNKTLAGKEEREAPGFKGNKDRVTIMLCANANGSLKLPLVLIGKYKNPRALKNIERHTLPVYYTHQSNAWMNTQIFELWFKEQFVPQVSVFLQNKNLPPKAILLLDNASCHSSQERLSVGDITAYFLPPNSTALIQPMDQGIIESVKRKYKMKLQTSILSRQKEDVDVISYLKSVTIKDVIYWISDAWNEIKESTIAKCWKNILPTDLYEENTESVSVESHISDTNFLSTY